MGLIKTATNSVGGGLVDWWLEVIEPNNMGDTTIMTKDVFIRKDDRRGFNRKGTDDVLTNGSVIHVYPNMTTLLVDGGKITDYIAEEGYYTVRNDSAPSMFNDSLKDAIAETFSRFKFGGVTPQKQQVFYINLQEIKGIKFGIPVSLNYFDNFYNIELLLCAHGNYSIKIIDPLLFYTDATPKSQTQVGINDINEQHLAEFITALQAAISQMSADGQRTSYVPSKSVESSKYMQTALDEDWHTNRDMEIVSVAVASISYTDDSTKLINMRNEGAMLSDPDVCEGYVQGSLARGMEAVGKNKGGAMSGFVGVGTGMNANDNYSAQALQIN